MTKREASQLVDSPVFCVFEDQSIGIIRRVEGEGEKVVFATPIDVAEGEDPWEERVLECYDIIKTEVDFESIIVVAQICGNRTMSNWTRCRDRLVEGYLPIMMVEQVYKSGKVDLDSAVPCKVIQ